MTRGQCSSAAHPPLRWAGPGDYLSRPGFWFGAIGVAACWLGGAKAVAAPLYRRAHRRAPRRRAPARSTRVQWNAAITAADAAFAAAAGHVDADPCNRSGLAELTARRVRAIAEKAVDETLVRTDRALGPGPLCLDERHAGCAVARTPPCTSDRATPSATLPSSVRSRRRKMSMTEMDSGDRQIRCVPGRRGRHPCRDVDRAGRSFASLDLNDCPGLTVIAPHPDDETMGLGATIATLRCAGVDVQAVSVSDGGPLIRY